MAGTLNFSTAIALGSVFSCAQIVLYNEHSNLNYYQLTMDTGN